MKIAVTTNGTGLQATVDPRFGRAQRFIIVDSETGGFDEVDNTQNLNAPQGAGIQAAAIVARTGANALITGHCGPKAFKALSAAGIEIFTGANGTVAEAIEAFKAGKLSRSQDADVEGHW